MQAPIFDVREPTFIKFRDTLGDHFLRRYPIVHVAFHFEDIRSPLKLSLTCEVVEKMSKIGRLGLNF